MHEADLATVSPFHSIPMSPSLTPSIVSIPAKRLKFSPVRGSATKARANGENCDARDNHSIIPRRHSHEKTKQSFCLVTTGVKQKGHSLAIVQWECSKSPTVSQVITWFLSSRNYKHEKYSIMWRVNPFGDLPQIVKSWIVTTYCFTFLLNKNMKKNK